SGIGRAVAKRLAAEGAHVVVGDLDEAGARKTAEEVTAAAGGGRAIGLRMDVTSEASVRAAFETTVLAYGGLDILVSNAGVAHSAAKAAEAQLAKVLALEGAPHGIRSNIVNPDAVFQDSKLWSEDVRRERAAAQGITVEQLEDFYRKRNLLGARILPEDVAEAVLFLASDRASKTTGCTLTVDGGVKDAFPR